MNTPDIFSRYRPAIENELRSQLAGQTMPLYDMMRYHLGWIDAGGNEAAAPSGKALRPTLCLLSCEAAGGNYARALPAAAAVELIHNFSLIHDDIQDNDEERRHRPTVWKVWGMPQAINAGTAMKILAGRALYRPNGKEIPDALRLRLLAILEETTLKLIEGQFLDIHFEDRMDISAEDYLAMVEGKTGALLACSMELGSLLGYGTDELVEMMKQIGKNLGLAFQIRDDYLGIWGDPDITGKPAGSDIVKKKKSIPVVIAMEKGNQSSREKIAQIYNRDEITGEDAGAVLSIMEDLGVREEVQEMVERYSRHAMESADALETALRVKRDIQDLITYLTERDS